MWSSLLPPLRGAALVATVYLAATAVGVPQEDPPKTAVLQTGSVRDALQGLESQVRELNAALLEMQAQVTRSRAEAQELRKDLEAARGQYPEPPRALQPRPTARWIPLQSRVKQRSPPKCHLVRRSRSSANGWPIWRRTNNCWAPRS